MGKVKLFRIMSYETQQGFLYISERMKYFSACEYLLVATWIILQSLTKSYYFIQFHSSLYEVNTHRICT